MALSEFLPDDIWQKHIAFFWVLKTEANVDPAGMRIYADGCSDLICNAGETTAYFYPLEGTDQPIPLYPGRLYLGGTMTAYGVLKGDPGCTLTGIRFWPGGFYALFSQAMESAVDATIEFPNESLVTLMQQTENLNGRLNQWLNNHLTDTEVQASGKYDFVYLRERMYQSGGQVKVEELADEMCISIRTLARIFKKNVGIPPKDFLRIVRFQEVLKRLQNADGKQSLLQIAFELGYYDHAHLTNEFKKYSGILPSELAGFYKTGISDGQYF